MKEIGIVTRIVILFSTGSQALIMDRLNAIPTVQKHVQYYAILYKTTNSGCHFDIIVL
jgi:hypothetical protein